MKLTRSLSLSSILAVGALLFTAPEASAFPRTKERAQLTLTFDLQPAATGSGTAAGTASIDVTRVNGTATAGEIDLELTGLADGTYTVDALLKSDAGATPVNIGSVVVAATPDPNAPVAEPLTLPEDVDPLDIASITVSDATPAVVLSGTATEAVTSWTYFGNRPLVAGDVTPEPIPGAKGKPKRIHGHILIHARVSNDNETRRKFLLVGHNLAPDTTYTVNLDGVAVGSVTTTKRGKAMLKSLTGDFRLAGVDLITLTDADGGVVAQADFFPDKQ